MGIANTHTLTSSSRSLPFDPASSCSINTVHFAPYTPAQLQAIVVKRLGGLPENEMKKMLPQASLILLTKKVAGQTGDVRVLFGVLRGAIDAALAARTTASAPTLADTKNAVIITPAHILSALKAYTSPSATSGSTQQSLSCGSATANSEIVSKVRGLNLQQRVVLLSLLIASKRICAGLHISSSSSSPPPKSPTKRSPMKRTQSTASVSSNVSSDAVGDASSGIDINHLYSFYVRILQDADTFNQVTRSEFSDVLAVLDTTGLVSMARSVTRSFKRSHSFTGKGSMTAGSQAGEAVKLQGDVREVEVTRGLGLDVSGEVTDPMEVGIRNLWRQEQSKLKKEKEAIARKKAQEGIDVFDDAMEG